MFVLPDAVRNWLTGVFGNANRAASSHLTSVPHAHEPSLDITLISSIMPQARPVSSPSDWLVRIDTQFLGGGRHFRNWEIADIGVLVMFRRAGELLRTKVALLQSKRLYANEQSSEDAPDYIGFGRLHEIDSVFAAAVAPRVFRFSETSRYRALEIGDDQYMHVMEYENSYGILIFCSFYNPLRIPVEVALPASPRSLEDGEVVAGCRVLPSHDFRTVVEPKVDGHAPSYNDVCSFSLGVFSQPEHRGGWRFEHFIVELLLGCRQGYKADDRTDRTLANLFGGRSAPISSAIAINIDAPANAGLSSNCLAEFCGFAFSANARCS